MLPEQLKGIQNLEKYDKDATEEKFRETLMHLTVPPDVMEVIDEQINKLSFLDNHSSEFSVTRKYLDCLMNIPWGKGSEENVELDIASAILDENHYGMEDVKKRILELLAINKLSGRSQGSLLCFYGPPGVGKSTISKSIAKALKKPFYRFSLGGIKNIAELNGQRKENVRSMPGKIIQALISTKIENPLIIIEGIDLIVKQKQICNALLEFLDPDENVKYLDKYLNIPMDLSKVLFICTANVTDTIPEPRRERLEMINISGYIDEEKITIAEHFIIPRARESTGVTAENLTITTGSIQKLLREYCREGGVRNLQKHIDKIFRKAAISLVKNEFSSVEVTANNLQNFIGKPVFTQYDLYKNAPAGVVMGLSWNTMGGSASFIEVIELPYMDQSQPFQITGNIGDVMIQSTYLAYAYAKTFLKKITKDKKIKNYLLVTPVHVHFTEMSDNMDGSSGGCAITTAFVSLALNKSVKRKLAMSGEISATGKILPVHGIKEKIMAAKRAGVSCVILPHANTDDVAELPKCLTSGLDIYCVKTFDDVYKIVFS